MVKCSCGAGSVLAQNRLISASGPPINIYFGVETTPRNAQGLLLAGLGDSMGDKDRTQVGCVQGHTCTTVLSLWSLPHQYFLWFCLLGGSTISSLLSGSSWQCSGGVSDSGDQPWGPVCQACA